MSRLLDMGKVLLMPKGEYSSNAQYSYLDFVLYNGASYVAKRSVRGVTPSDNSADWQKLSDTNDYTGITRQYAEDAQTAATSAAQQLALAQQTVSTARQEIHSEVEDQIDSAKADIVADAQADIDEAKETAVQGILSYIDYVEQQAEIATDKASIATTQASNAATYAQTCVTKTNEAMEAAQSLSNSVEQSAQNASAAAESAQTATTKANEASTSASNAASSASNALNSADNASTSASNAASSAQTAITKANEASASATSASNSATSASNSAQTAVTKASQASDSADEAEYQANLARGYFVNTQNLLDYIESDTALRNVVGATVTAIRNNVSLIWSDPADVIIDGKNVALWDGTKVVRKEGSIPANQNDGVLIVDSKVRDEYIASAYIDEDLDYTKTYYYRWFPYSKAGVYTSSTALSVTIIAEKVYVLPSQIGSLTYTGSPQTAQFKDYNSDQLFASDITATNAGTYTATFTPKQGYSWSDNTTTGRQVSWTIGKAIVETVPSQSGALTYTGSAQTPSWSNYNSNILDITGDTSGTNAGTYTAAFTPNSNYTWANGTSTPVDVNWTIGKANGSVTLSKQSVVLTNLNPIETITFTNATGNISVTSNDTTIVSASLSDNTIILSSASQISGEATISVQIAESANALSSTVTIDVETVFTKVVTWANGTDAEICDMVDSALAGEMNLRDYWAVGDERQITLSAMPSSNYVSETHNSETVTFVILQAGLYEFSSNPVRNTRNEVVVPKDTSNQTRTDVSFVIGMKNNFTNYGYMNSTASNLGTWDACGRRIWCNTICFNAIPSSISPIFAEFKTVTAETYNGTTLTTSNDKLAILAVKEVCGLDSYSNPTESETLLQLDYYATASNRIRSNGGNNANLATGDYTWTRSPYKSSEQRYCCIDPNGNPERGRSANDLDRGNGISVFGCIK